MSVAVQADFMAGVADFGELGRERFDAVGWGEEGGFDVVFGVEVEEAVDAYCGAVNSARDVCGVLFRAVTGVDPVCYCVYVDWGGGVRCLLVGGARVYLLP